MTFHYDADLDQLAVRLVDRPSTESIEVRDGFVLDLDAEGSVVGFEVEHASRRVDLHSLTLGALPIDELQVTRATLPKYEYRKEVEKKQPFKE